jgi:hypothetical protein
VPAPLHRCPPTLQGCDRSSVTRTAWMARSRVRLPSIRPANEPALDSGGEGPRSGIRIRNRRIRSSTGRGAGDEARTRDPYLDKIRGRDLLELSAVELRLCVGPARDGYFRHAAHSDGADGSGAETTRLRSEESELSRFPTPREAQARPPEPAPPPRRSTLRLVRRPATPTAPSPIWIVGYRANVPRGPHGLHRLITAANSPRK